jgi:autophagy-related protein 101
MDPSPSSQPPRPPTYTLELFADPQLAKEVIKAVLHTIFFHRYFTPVVPLSRDLLDLTLPAIDDVDLETLIEQRADSLVQELGSGGAGGPSRMGVEGRPGGARAGNGGGVAGRGQLVCQFFEKRRRKAYFGFGKDEEVCWEQWTLDVTLGSPRTETGKSRIFTRGQDGADAQSEVIKVRRAMETSLQRTTMKIVDIVNRDKGHIPPITTTEQNPFPYHILVNPRNEGWGQKMGIF